MSSFDLSASKVALALACPGSFVLPHLDEKHGGQQEGIDLHAEYEDAINMGIVPDVLEERWPGYTWRSEVAFAVDLSDGFGRELGTKIARAYKRMSPLEVFGTVDALGRGPAGEVVIVDRKSFDPRVPRAAVNPQLHTLALAVCRTFGVEECDVAIHHELRPLDVAALNWAHLEAIHGDLLSVIKRVAAARRQLREGTLQLSPGSHCRYCPAFMGPDGVACPAQKTLQVDLESDVVVGQINGMIPFENDNEAADAYELLARIRLFTRRLTDALYARAAERPIPLHSGKMFGLAPKKAREKLDADIVYEVVRAKHGQAIADSAVERVATKAGLDRALTFVNGKSRAALKRDVLEIVDKKGGIDRGADKMEVQEYDAQLRLVAGGKP